MISNEMLVWLAIAFGTLYHYAPLIFASSYVLALVGYAGWRLWGIARSL